MFITGFISEIQSLRGMYQPCRVVHGSVVGVVLVLVVVVVAVLALLLLALRLLGLALRQRRPVGVQLLPRRVLGGGDNAWSYLSFC